MFEEQNISNSFKNKKVRINLVDLMPFLIEKGLEKAELYVEFPIAIWVQRRKPVSSYIKFVRGFETKEEYNDAIANNEGEELKKEIYKHVMFKEDVEWTKDFLIRIYVTKEKDLDDTIRYNQDNKIKHFDVKLYEAEEVYDLGNLQQFIKSSKNESKTNVFQSGSSSNSFLSSISAKDFIELVNYIRNLDFGRKKDYDYYEEDYEKDTKNIKEDVDESLFTPNIQASIQPAQNQPQNQNNILTYLELVPSIATAIKSVKDMFKDNNITEETLRKAISDAVDKVRTQYETMIQNIQNKHQLELKEKDNEINLLKEKLDFYINELNKLKKKEDGGDFSDATIITPSGQ